MRYSLIRWLLSWCIVLLLGACDRSPAKLLSKEPIRPPEQASVELTASSLGSLLRFLQPVSAGKALMTQREAIAGELGFSPASIAGWNKHGADIDGPALFFCDRHACALRPSGRWSVSGGDSTGRLQESRGWIVDDPRGRWLIWGPESTEQLNETLARWRRPGRDVVAIPEHRDVAGRVDLDPLLRRWDLEDPRARALVDRAMRQTEHVRLEASVREGTVELNIDLEQRAAEPRFVEQLGRPGARLPRVAGLVDRGVLGVARLSADPERVWVLLRSLLSVEQRGALDQTLEKLRDEAALDVRSVILSNVVGHAVVAAYGLDPTQRAPGPADWLTLGATREVVVIPIVDPVPIRRLFDAWTQLSRGRLHVQKTRGERLQWAWMEEGDLKWSAIVGRDYVAFVDSNVALEHLTQWEKHPAPLSDALVKRGVDTLLDPTARSGLYLDVAALRAIFGDDFEAWLPTLDAVTLVEEPSQTTVIVRLAD